MEPLKFRYIFTFAGGRRTTYDLTLDPTSLELLRPEGVHGPFWAKLAFYQCPNCPLDPWTVPFCPAAFALGDLVGSCSSVISHDPVRMEVVTPERTIFCDTTAQRGFSSLMGLLMAASGCPHTRCFRPMARFHLPLASEEETFYRAASMYLLAQYFIRKEGGEADLELDGLKRIYGEMQVVNRTLAARIRAASYEDSTINALILLDLFARAMPGAIGDSMEELGYLFTPFLSPAGEG